MGNVLFYLNNEQFQKGFLQGRRFYFEDIHGEHPERIITLQATDILDQVLIRDKNSGSYSFDFEAPYHPVDLLAVFLGYATAPIFSETEEEREQRLKAQEQMEQLPDTEPLIALQEE